MAEDFKALVAAQKETSRLLMTVEERAAADQSKQESNFERSESARRGWETRRENLALTEQQATINQNQALYHAQEDGEDTANTGEEQSGYLSKLLNLFKKDSDKSGAAAEEDESKGESRDSKMMGYLKQTAGFLGGIAKQGMEKVKSGLGGLSKFLIGGLAVAALAFLNHPKFKEMIALLTKTIIPLLAIFYDEVLVPIGKSLAKLFKDIGGYLKDGDPSLMSVLMENKLAILGIITALAPGLVFGALKFAVMGIGKAVVFLVSKLSFGAIFAKIGLAFGVIKAFFVATLMPFLAAAAVPIAIIVGVVAAIVLAIYSLKQGFDDFMFELEATGSIWEATKTGIVSVISNILGLPFDLLKDGVSWIIGKIGSVFGLESFTNASKVLDEFSFVDSMRDMLTFLGDSIAGVFDGFMQVIQDFLRSGALGFLGGDKAADILFGTKEKQATEKKIEEAQQKRMVEDRKALRQKQKLDKAAEKAAEEAKKLEKIKAEQEAKQAKQRKKLELEKKILGPKANAFLAEDLKPRPPPPVPGATVVNAPTSVVNANSSSNTTTSTPVRQPNAVIGMIATAG